jgi:hypothetical protein
MSPLTMIHVVAGTLALAGGYSALALRKGQRGHAIAGQIFASAMLLMTVSALAMALLRAQRLNALSACLTLYLVASGWHAARDRSRTTGHSMAFAAGIAATIAIAGYGLGWQALQPGFSDGDHGGAGNFAAAYFVFATLALLACLHDMRVIRRGGCLPGQRIARHLWRMCLALAISAAALFLGQQDEMADWMLGPHLLVPPLAALLWMAWWLVKMRKVALSAPAAPSP